eukprot:4659287-Amphidinium_carterae.1
MEAYYKLIEQSELSPAKTSRFWREDEMFYIHSMFCPKWTDLIRRHSLVNSARPLSQVSSCATSTPLSKRQRICSPRTVLVSVSSSARRWQLDFTASAITISH